MKKSIVVFVFSVFICAFGAFAQLKVNSSGNIGIDTDIPASRFSIGAAGFTNSKVYVFNSNASSSQKGLEVSQALTNEGWSYGTISSVVTGSSSSKVVGVRGSGYKSSVYSSGMSFGVYGIAGNATTGYNYGVYGQLLGTNNGAAIFGATPGYSETSVNGIYAGYFRGKVFIEDKVGIKTTSPSYDLDVNGTIRCVSITQTSDLGIKKNVRNIDKGSLRNVANLNGVKYKLKTPEELGLTGKPVLASDTGKVNLPANSLSPEHYNKEFTGFIAQDVQKVFPDLVSEDKDGILSINYVGLIPVLVEAIKEQQAQIDELKKQINK